MVSYSVAGSSFLFVETEAFTERVRELLDDDTYRAFQNDLVRSPGMGAGMPGCGGLRKARIGEPERGKGKRGGCRVIYLIIPEVERIDLLAIYSKNTQDNLTVQQCRAMKTLAEKARREALTRRSFCKEL